MKRLLLYALLAGAGAAQAQTTAPSITAADMPAAGDTLRLSLALALPASAPALTQAGANQTWNYAALVPAAQRVDSYLSAAAASTGLLQTLAFGPLGGVNRATLAQPRSLPVTGGLTLPVTDPKEFFNLSTSDFRSVGFGVTYGSDGIPITYSDQAHQDVIYRFPLTYGSAGAVSYSYFQVSVPGVGTASQRRQRTNAVDGWGTLTTPYGTFQALRVVTTLVDRDSVVVGTAPGGPATLLPTQRQYKWLAQGVHVPVLTITTTEVAGTQQVSSIEYRDAYRRPAALASRSGALGASLGAYPNPSAVGAALRLAVPAGSGPVAVAATDVVGRALFSGQYPRGAASEVVLDAAALGEYRGVLLLTVTTSQGTATCRVVRQ